MKSLIISLLIGLSTSLFAQPGTLDTSFGNAGKVTNEIPGSLHATAIQSNGKILVTGSIGDSLFVGRYLTKGNLDTSFGHNGLLLFGYGGSDFSGSSLAIVVQPDGKILFGGNWWAFLATSYLILSRLNEDGTIDNSFGLDGVVKADYNSLGVTSIALQKDGKIIVGGGNGLAMGVLRFLPNGVIDPDFGENGFAPVFYTGNSYGCFVAVQADGKILAAHTNYADIGLARYKPNGTFDSTFGDNGKSIIDVSGTDDRAYAVLLQPDQKIIIAGGFNFDFYNTNFGVARFKPNGTLDSSFGDYGKTSVDFSGSVDIGYAAALQSDGKVIVAGTINDHFGLARYKTNGATDSSFAVNGYLTTDFGNVSEGANGVLLQQDGKIVASGQGGYPAHFVLARYNNDIITSITNIKSGLWSDQATWSNNKVPEETSVVELNFDVIVDINAKCKSLRANQHAVFINQNVNLLISGSSK